MANSKTLALCLCLLWCGGSFSEVELPFETRDKVDKSVSAANSITSAILSWMEFKASPEKGAEMLVMQMEPDTETQKQQIAIVQKLPSKRVAMLLKSIRYLTPFLSTFSTLGSVVSCLLAFIPQEDPVMTLLKQKFADVNRKLDEVSMKVSSLPRDVRWNNYASTYAREEINIRISWDKFKEFTQSSLVATSPEEKKQLALRFTMFYEDTVTEGAVASFYHYLTQPAGPTLLENLLDLVVEKFKGDLRMVTQFTSYFTSLMTKGFQLDMYYYAMKGYDEAPKAKDTAAKFSNLLAAIESAMHKCIVGFEKWALEDAKLIGAKEWSSTAQLATTIKRNFEEKFYWYEWTVIAHNKDDSNQHPAGNYLTVTAGDKYSVYIFHREKGAEVDESVRKQIADMADSQQNEVCKESGEIYTYLTSRMDNAIVRHITGFYTVSDPTDYYQTNDQELVKRTCSVRNWSWVTYTYTFFLRSKEAIQESPCDQLRCQNGECRFIPDTKEEYCSGHLPLSSTVTYKWEAKMGIPADSVMSTKLIYDGGDTPGKEFYVCRVRGPDNAWHAGKLYRVWTGEFIDKHLCSYAYGSKEYKSLSYEVLLYQCEGRETIGVSVTQKGIGVKWVHGVPAEDKVESGSLTELDKNYVCRTRIHYDPYPGELRYTSKNEWKCYIGYEGKSLEFKPDETLVKEPCKTH